MQYSIHSRGLNKNKQRYKCATRALREFELFVTRYVATSFVATATVLRESIYVSVYFGEDIELLFT